MKKITILPLFFSLFLSLGGFAQETGSEEDVLDFSSIRSILKKDMLEDQANKKVKSIKAKVAKKRKSAKAKYNIPGSDDFWSFLSEYWLIQNEPILKWDFKKPEYGVNKAFQDLLESFGFYDVQFRILYLNSSHITHAILPSSKKEMIFLVSVPFIRSLNLSKTEVSLLLLEDYLRGRKELMQKKMMTPELKGLIGGNLKSKKAKLSVIEKTLKKYDEILMEKGFTFKEQFEITQEIDRYLKTKLSAWSAYYQLIQKIDDFTSTNLLYRNYRTIYRSPEIQLKWLKPKKDIL